MISEDFKKNEMWSWRELLSLLILVLVVVPISIEYGVYHYLLEFFHNELYAGTLTGLVMAAIFIAGLYWIVLKPNADSWETVGVRSFPLKHWKLMVFWTIMLIVISVGLVIIMDFLGVGTENSKTESLQTNITLSNFMIAFFSASIVSPIYEEIFYRGFLYGFFSSRCGILSGMLISSLIFTLVHIPTFNTLPVNFVSGLIFAWVYQKTGSVIPSILIHGVFNGIAVILTSIA